MIPAASSIAAFCDAIWLEDGLAKNSLAAYRRDLQGLASWWADSYHQSTPLQELEVTHLPDGEYYLTHLADPEDHWIESDDTNNFTWVKFRLTRSSANAKVGVLDHSPCVPEIICGFGGNP